MNHNQYRESLQLSVYDELTSEEKRILDEHLLNCEECRREQLALTRFRETIAKHKPADPDDRLLSEARHQLRAALNYEQRKPSLSTRFAEMMSGLFGPRARLAYGALAILAMGFFGGYLLFSSRQSEVITGKETGRAIAQDEPTKITDVRFINTDLEKGEVEFMFDAVKPVRMKGSINDERIHRVLTHAILAGDNPGIRLQSINAVTSHQLPDREIRTALIGAMKTDQNAGVRQEALKALQKFPMDPEIRDALLFVLSHDNNPGLRIAAINHLDSAKAVLTDEAIQNILREKMQSDDNNYIRLRAKAVVKEINQ